MRGRDGLALVHHEQRRRRRWPSPAGGGGGEGIVVLDVRDDGRGEDRATVRVGGGMEAEVSELLTLVRFCFFDIEARANITEPTLKPSNCLSSLSSF